MSKQQFNQFLVEKVIEWFSLNLKVGNRYGFYSDDQSQISSLIKAFHEKNNDQSIDFLLDKDSITLAYIEINGIKLIVIDDISMNPYFISSIRDALSKNTDCSLLILYTNKLDTLISAITDLTIIDHPLNPNRIRNILAKIISQKTQYKVIFEYLLEHQSKIIEEEQQSVFGYEILYDSISENKINFSAFKLFEDIDIYGLDEGLIKADKSKIEKRITENDKLYRKIKDAIVNFPNELEDKLPEFSPGFIKENITTDDWEKISFNKLKIALEDNKGPKISFAKLSCNHDFEIRDDSTTAAGQKKKNIIILAEHKDVKLSFDFEGKGIKESSFSITHNKEFEKLYSNKIKYDGVKRLCTFEFEFDLKPLYFTINFKGNKSSENYSFKILVLQKNTFYFEDIKNCFIVRPNHNELLLQVDSFNVRLNDNQTLKAIKLTQENEEIDYEEYNQVNFRDFYNNHDDIKFSIVNGDSKLTLNIEASKEDEIISIPFLFNVTKLDKLFGINKDIEYKKNKNKAVFENREFSLIADRLQYIKYEQRFIDEQMFAFVDDEKKIEKLKDINQEIYTSFKNLIDYFRKYKTTPSLCAWNDELYELSKKFTSCYLKYFESIQENTSLSNEAKQLFELGFMQVGNKTYVSPFSPLVLSYIVHLIEEAKKDNTYKDLSEITLSRLNPKGLFPYLFIDNDNYAFTKSVKENSIWLEFVPNEDNEFSYVKKLTFEKINEFTSSFKKLFEFRHDAPLIINSINNGSNKELFEGIIDFYQKSTLPNPIKMIVNLYDEHYIETSFDIFADLDSYDQIKNKFNQFNNDADTIIDTIRTHLSYSKHLISEPQTYCHLSFFKNNEKVVIQNRTLEQTKSGLVANGLISGESSQKENGYYFSGFGLHNIYNPDKAHLKLAKLYNALQRPVYEQGTNYESNKTIALMISENFKNLLKESYQNALWTVIIDPKVTLEFFDNEDDIILIHYSDQYSSSANYDAVTVTAQKELYSNVIFSDNQSLDKENIVRQFNAFNGEWLIKMITENDKIKKERIGIICAYKYITALLNNSEITWVPISIAEMIRVSGNVGLSMSGSDFSRYNLNKNHNEKLHKGEISDDILLVGLYQDKIVLYPVEVKASSADMQKACEQAKSLKKFFYEYLFSGNTFKTKLLKGLFIRQVFLQIEKYELYKIFDENYFNLFYLEREELLKGTFELGELQDHSIGSVVAFLDNNQDFTNMQLKDEVLEIRLPYQFQNQMITIGYDDLKLKLESGQFGTNIKYLLKSATVIERKVSEDESIIEEKSNDSVEVEEVEKILVDETLKFTMPIEVKFGIDNTYQKDIFWHPTNTIENQNTNTGIIGTMGTGKTQFTKSLVTQLVNQSHNNVNGKKIDMIIFDYKGDYIDDKFITATNAKVLKPYNLPFNPFSLYGKLDLLPIHTTNQFVTTISKVFGLGEVQKTRLDDIVTEAYEAYGISPVDEETWANSVPTLNDIWEIYNSSEKAPVDSLYAALKKIQKFKIFESKSELTKPLFDIIDGVTVIKLSGYDPDIQNLIVAITLDLFYTQMHNRGSSEIDGDFRQITKMILVDEADNFMSQDFESLKKILKEGREFGVGTILSTQELTHFKTAEDNYANYIFTWIIHKVSNIKTQDIQSIFNISNKSEAENLMSQVRELDKHFSFYVDGKKTVRKMRDLAFWELCEENKNEN